jgi:ethanolamine utilization protein EutN
MPAWSASSIDGISNEFYRASRRPETTLMQIGRVVGTLVATQKHHRLGGAKLLLVQPLTLEGGARGVPLLAVDSVGAGVGERVLVVLEGRAAGEALGRRAAPVDAAIVGIVDQISLDESVQAPTPNRVERRG